MFIDSKIFPRSFNVVNKMVNVGVIQIRRVSLPKDHVSMHRKDLYLLQNYAIHRDRRDYRTDGRTDGRAS